MIADRYRRAVQELWRKLKAGLISRTEFDAQSAEAWQRYLVAKHLDDGDTTIFVDVAREAKHRYAIAKDSYYLGRINIRQYIWRRGYSIGEGISWYDFRLVQLKLSRQLIDDRLREEFSWKSLKVERSIIPDSCRNGTNNVLCPRENEQAAGQTLRLLFELFDTYNRDYVPTLGRDWRIRDRSWIDVDGEEVAFTEPYLPVTLTAAEIAQYRRWRDGIGPTP